MNRLQDDERAFRVANLINGEGDSEARDNSLRTRIFLTGDEGGRLQKEEGLKVIEAKSDTHTFLESRTQVNYCVKVTKTWKTVVRHDRPIINCKRKREYK